MSEEPYNPLDKINLARSIESELLARRPVPLTETDRISGAGVYAIYYIGDFAPYAPISNPRFATPIYVGKAIPKGGRKGGLSMDAAKGRALADRLRQHAASIDESTNLELADFFARYLVVDDIWIPLGENVLIESFKPIWNRAVDGFGNKDPGVRRAGQFKSPWDVLHPGREFADKLADGGVTMAFMLERVGDYFAGRALKRLPKALLQDLEVADVEADET